MFHQFFAAKKWSTTLLAWSGLVLVVLYSIFMAYIKVRINTFYTTFYDLMQSASTDSGSGETSQNREEVKRQLLSFFYIVAPLVTASPAAKWVRSAWSLEWRLCLMNDYLKSWDVTKSPIEGAAQRLHEDTQRFCNSLQGCVAVALDAFFTLIAFSPILCNLSSEITPPIYLGGFRGVWLFVTAVLAALFGLSGAAFIGRHLVALEVCNQQVEGFLRTDLVKLEMRDRQIENPEVSQDLFFKLQLQRKPSL